MEAGIKLTVREWRAVLLNHLANRWDFCAARYLVIKHLERVMGLATSYTYTMLVLLGWDKWIKATILMPSIY